MYVTSVPAADWRHTGDEHIRVWLGPSVMFGPASIVSPFVPGDTFPVGYVSALGVRGPPASAPSLLDGARVASSGGQVSRRHATIDCPSCFVRKDLVKGLSERILFQVGAF